MAVIYEKVSGVDLNDYVAHMPGVVDGVGDKASEVQAIAEGIFAAHDRPGGHSIGGGRDGITDSYIYLDGPVPHIIEYGRAGYITKKPQPMGEGGVVPAGTHIPAWEGTHVLRKTWETA